MTDKVETCQWPVGDDPRHDDYYCGKPVPKGSKQPYCEEHGGESVDTKKTQQTDNYLNRPRNRQLRRK